MHDPCHAVYVRAQLRAKAYKSVMSAGMTKRGRAWLGVKLAAGDMGLWCLLCMLALMEKLNKWRIYGPALPAL